MAEDWITAKTGASVLSPPLSPEAPARNRGRKKWLRLIGALFLAGSLALMIVPVSYPWANFGGEGRTDCGVPLQAMFRPPGEGCGGAAVSRTKLSIAAAGVGLLLIAVSGVRRRLLFLGLVLVGSSVYPMLLATYGRAITIHNDKTHASSVYVCGSALGDLARRGYSQVSWGGGTWGLQKQCSDMAVHRLYVTLGMAGAGFLLIGGAAMKSRANLNGESLPQVGSCY
jgi:hypothetical protein